MKKNNKILSIDTEKDLKMDIFKRILTYNDKQKLRDLQRAFLKWVYELPIYQKCDELWKQLKERTKIADTLRSSYLRDVLSVKLYVDKITNIDASNPNNLKDITDIKNEYSEAIPSFDLRGMIENAKTCFSRTSEQMTESLIDAGLVDEFTLKTLNPWEQSKGFKRSIRITNNPTYEYPESGGGSVGMYAPRNKKLFIKYCDQCIGIMKLVKTWNFEVENCLNFMTTCKILESELIEFKKVNMSLNSLLADKELEIFHLTKHIEDLEQANSWFKKWSKMQEYDALVDSNKELRKNLVNVEGMAKADLESTVFNYQKKFYESLHTYELNEINLNQKLQNEIFEKEYETMKKNQFIDELNKANEELNKKNEVIENLNKTIQEGIEKNNSKASELERIANEKEQADLALALKAKNFDALRMKTFNEIDTLAHDYKIVSMQCAKQENDLDILRQELRLKKVRNLFFIFLLFL
jgi:hypothetical protein